MVQDPSSHVYKARNLNALNGIDQISPEPDSKEVVPDGHLGDKAGRRSRRGDEVFPKVVGRREEEEGVDGKIRPSGP